MDIQKSMDYCKELLSQHLPDKKWEVVAGNTKKAIGRCHYRQGMIVVELSTFFWDHLTDEGANDTVRHEVAHAICGPGHGHGSKWKATARMLGARPEGSSGDWKFKPGSKSKISKSYKYTLTCMSCDNSGGLSRLSGRVSGYIRRTGKSPFRCKKCGSTMKIRQNY